MFQQAGQKFGLCSMMFYYIQSALKQSQHEVQHLKKANERIKHQKSKESDDILAILSQIGPTGSTIKDISTKSNAESVDIASKYAQLSNIVLSASKNKDIRGQNMPSPIPKSSGRTAQSFSASKTDINNRSHASNMGIKRVLNYK